MKQAGMQSVINSSYLINGTIWAIKLVLAKSTTQTDTQ
jgi:ATP sulfurylase